MIQNNSHLSLSNINDSLATSASTPISINDPNDDLWFEFLNSLHEPKPQDTSLNSKTKLDDDANEDPDFTVCLERNNNNNKSPIQTTEIQPNVIVETPITNLNFEYIPQFTELQRKQLDEQLRNVS